MATSPTKQADVGTAEVRTESPPTTSGRAENVQSIDTVVAQPPPNSDEVACDSISWDSNANQWSKGSHKLKDFVTKPHSDRAKVEIYFLPRVDEFPSTSVTEKISENFFTPKFFWTHTGWNANGFYGSLSNPLGDQCEESYASYSRFLIKELLLAPNEKNVKAGDLRAKHEPVSPDEAQVPSSPAPKKKSPPPSNDTNGYGYRWQYLAFVTLWFRPKNKATGGVNDKEEAKLVVLCFDQSPVMKGILTEQFESSKRSTLQDCPYGIYEILLTTIFSYYDWALWDFQKPVRDWEKSREDLIKQESYQRRDMVKRYTDMHELGRHIIHLTETLDVAARTIKSMRDAHRARCSSTTEKAKPCFQQLQGDFEFFNVFLENLQSRAQAFERRLRNEIKLAFNLFAADDNATAKEILKESQHDGRDLTNLVALLTLIFLPSSFMTSFFGMHFFDPERSNLDLSHPRRLWLFFAISVPISLIAVISWIAWRRWKAKERESEKKKARDRVGGQGSKTPEPKVGALARAASYLPRPGQKADGVNSKDFAMEKDEAKGENGRSLNPSPPSA